MSELRLHRSETEARTLAELVGQLRGWAIQKPDQWPRLARTAAGALEQLLREAQIWKAANEAQLRDTREAERLAAKTRKAAVRALRALDGPEPLEGHRVAAARRELKKALELRRGFVPEDREAERYEGELGELRRALLASWRRQMIWTQEEIDYADRWADEMAEALEWEEVPPKERA